MFTCKIKILTENIMMYIHSGWWEWWLCHHDLWTSWKLPRCPRYSSLPGTRDKYTSYL